MTFLLKVLKFITLQEHQIVYCNKFYWLSLEMFGTYTALCNTEALTWPTPGTMLNTLDMQQCNISIIATLIN